MIEKPSLKYCLLLSFRFNCIYAGPLPFLGNGKPSVSVFCNVNGAVPDEPGPVGSVGVQRQVFQQALHGDGVGGNQKIALQASNLFQKDPARASTLLSSSMPSGAGLWTKS